MAETLDGLAADDPLAQRSRRDLRRIHRIMGSRGIVCGALRRTFAPAQAHRPLRILELGAGDGTLLLGVARRLAPEFPQVALTLLDRQALLAPGTAAAYAALGWSAHAQTLDVFDWAAADAPDAHAVRWDLIVANLFLHHFDTGQLAPLLQAVARRCDRFLAVEPRRARLALVASHLVGAVGANAVTRTDAVLSVHAGFRGNELGALWSVGRGAWEVREYAGGWFSHVFAAQRRAGVAG